MLPLGSGELETISNAAGPGGGAGAVDTSLQPFKLKMRARNTRMIHRTFEIAWNSDIETVLMSECKLHDVDIIIRKAS